MGVVSLVALQPALDSADEQVFARDLLRKVSASALARVEATALSHGERQRSPIGRTIESTT